MLQPEFLSFRVTFSTDGGRIHDRPGGERVVARNFQRTLIDASSRGECLRARVSLKIAHTVLRYRSRCSSCLTSARTPGRNPGKSPEQGRGIDGDLKIKRFKKRGYSQGLKDRALRRGAGSRSARMQIHSRDECRCIRIARNFEKPREMRGKRVSLRKR